VFTLYLASQQYKERKAAQHFGYSVSTLRSARPAVLGFGFWLAGWTGLDWKEENVAFDVSRGRFCLDVFVFFMSAGEQLLGRKYQAFYLGLGLSPIVILVPTLPCLAGVCPATTTACVISEMGGPRRRDSSVAFLALLLFSRVPGVVGGWVSE
jgi:hypothetical protein